MINEMKKSFKAILYERVTSPLSGIFILSWLIFNWKACLVLALGDDSIYKRIFFVQANCIDIYYNIYYPVLYTIAFIILYPWITLGPFYIWQVSTHIKNKIKNKFEMQTPLSLEKSIELRREMRQKEIEFTEMMTAKNMKQVELETEVLHLHKLVQEGEIKLLAISDMNNTNITTGKSLNTIEEQKWDKEYTEVYSNDSFFEHYLSNVIDGIANGNVVDSSSKRYCLSQCLIDMTEDKISLTKKGEYLSKFTDNEWQAHHLRQASLNSGVATAQSAP